MASTKVSKVSHQKSLAMTIKQETSALSRLMTGLFRLLLNLNQSSPLLLDLLADKLDGQLQVVNVCSLLRLKVLVFVPFLHGAPVVSLVHVQLLECRVHLLWLFTLVFLNFLQVLLLHLFVLGPFSWLLVGNQLLSFGLSLVVIGCSQAFDHCWAWVHEDKLVVIL